MVLDSGFCVVKGIAELAKKGVYAGALTKKKRYWPKGVPGDDIIAHMVDKAVGEIDALRMMVDGTSMHMYAMKDTDYTMMIMSSYSCLDHNDEHNTKWVWMEDGKQKIITFNYPEPMSIHFKFRHQVDDHNNCRHSPISIEETWGTKYWPDRVFAFVLAVTEVNSCKAAEYFQNDGAPISQLAYRRKLAMELMTNTLDGATDSVMSPSGNLRKKRKLVSHDPLKIPNFCGKFQNGQWTPVATKWLQQLCHGCSMRTRTYCSCNKSVYMCITCYAEHVSEV